MGLSIAALLVAMPLVSCGDGLMGWPSFTISYNANGGSGSMGDSRHGFAVASTLSPNRFTRPGHDFAGWSTTRDGPAVFTDGQRISGLGLAESAWQTVTLYAVWGTGDGAIVGAPDGVSVPGATLADQLAWVRSHAVAGGSYAIEIGGNQNMPPQTLVFGDRRNVTVTLWSPAPRTVGLSSNGSLFTLGANATLVLHGNVTLQGRVGNDRALVEVNDGGAFVMSAGSRITGNANPTGLATAGGGVRVNIGGRFDMPGGAVSGNSASQGGGVFVATGGTFRIGAGTVHGSDAPLAYRNTGNGAALFSNGTAQRGVFNAAGAFTPQGALTSSNNTIP